MPWYLQATAIVFGVALIWFIAATMKRDDRKRHMSEQIDNLSAAEQGLEASVDRAIAELKELHDLLHLQGAIDSGDMAQVQAVADAIKAKTAVLDAAVADNAPPAPVTS